MSMHTAKLATCIKVAGKVLREQKDKTGDYFVTVPFGSEYSIYLKNLNSVRALVRVSLDGKSVTDGEDLVIYGNSELNLERYLLKGNMESGNRFKFIERTGKIEAHRGIEAEDGLVRVEFQFEKVTPKPVVVETIHTHKHYHDDYRYYPRYNPLNPWYDPYWYGSRTFYNAAQPGNLGSGFGDVTCYSMSVGSGGPATLLNASGAIGSASASINTVGIPQNAGAESVTLTSGSGPSGQSRNLRSRSATKSSKNFVAEQSLNDAGITVPGSISDQKFQSATWFPVDDEKFVIVLKLLGEVGGHIVEHAVTTKTKQTCPTCGTRNRGKIAQFCRDCGTALEIVGQSPQRIAAKR